MLEIQAMPESTGLSFRAGFQSSAPWPGQDEFPEAPDMPPRVRAIIFLCISMARQGEWVNVTAQNWGLCPTRGPDVLLLCPSV